jgi:hypothetical protein
MRPWRCLLLHAEMAAAALAASPPALHNGMPRPQALQFVSIILLSLRGIATYC